MLTHEHAQVGSSAVLEVQRDQGSLRVCRLRPEIVMCTKEWGRVCLGIRTEGCSHTKGVAPPRGLTTAKPFIRFLDLRQG